jgi:hypothetical protein
VQFRDDRVSRKHLRAKIISCQNKEACVAYFYILKQLPTFLIQPADNKCKYIAFRYHPNGLRRCQLHEYMSEEHPMEQGFAFPFMRMDMQTSIERSHKGKLAGLDHG